MTKANPSADPCMATLRDLDRDRYLSTLFAPADKRPALAALYAFDAEMSRLRERASAPLIGEVRLHWWRDVFNAERSEEARGNPIAKTLLAAIARHRLPREAFLSYLEARLFDLYDDPFLTIADLEAYCGQTSSAVLRLATLILADGGDPGSADAAGHAGVALGVVAMLRAMQRPGSRRSMLAPLDCLNRHGLNRDQYLSGQPQDIVAAARGAVWKDMIGLARSHRAKAESKFQHGQDQIAPAFLTLALVEPRLRSLGRSGPHPIRQAKDLSLFRRQWILWRAARGG